jgi:hypothetical protein
MSIEGPSSALGGMAETTGGSVEEREDGHLAAAGRAELWKDLVMRARRTAQRMRAGLADRVGWEGWMASWKCRMG